MEIHRTEETLRRAIVFSPDASIQLPPPNLPPQGGGIQEKAPQGGGDLDLATLDVQIVVARKRTQKSGTELSEPLRPLIRAANNAPLFIVEGNMPSDFHLTRQSEVDPGSQASLGVDNRGNRIWVVDQKVRFDKAPPDAVEAFLDGFFCGKAAGPGGNGPRMKLLAVERNGVWEEVPEKDNTDFAALSSPFADSTIGRFIVHVYDVHPISSKIGEIFPGGSFTGIVDNRQTIRGPDRSEFTIHFLNPDKTRGPFPGTTDGAVRFRASRNSDGGATLEGYYVTREATQFLDNISDFVPGMKTGKAFFSLGHSLYKLSPMGILTGGLTDGMMEAGESLADAAIGSTSAVRKAVAAFHARYYRTVLFPNLAGVQSGALQD
ncbi:MAG: hypothetical protein HYU64_20635 [Armatimonadetes bacterium]|nr:hypothetical protein [Armatimonadota bacterium]